MVVVGVPVVPPPVPPPVVVVVVVVVVQVTPSQTVEVLVSFVVVVVDPSGFDTVSVSFFVPSAVVVVPALAQTVTPLTSPGASPTLHVDGVAVPSGVDVHVVPSDE